MFASAYWIRTRWIIHESFLSLLRFIFVILNQLNQLRNQLVKLIQSVSTFKNVKYSGLNVIQRRLQETEFPRDVSWGRVMIQMMWFFRISETATGKWSKYGKWCRVVFFLYDICVSFSFLGFFSLTGGWKVYYWDREKQTKGIFALKRLHYPVITGLEWPWFSTHWPSHLKPDGVPLGLDKSPGLGKFSAT